MCESIIPRSEQRVACRHLPTNKKNYAAGIAISHLPPEKPLAGATRRKRKNRPRGRQFPFWFRIGAILRRNPNPFPRKSLKLSPNACGRTRPLGTARHTLCLFFGNFPRRILFFSCKGWSGDDDYCQSSRGVGASLRRRSRRAPRFLPTVHSR